MRKKNWVEFNNEQFLNEDNLIKENVKGKNKINIYKQKKGRKGKIVTIISGLYIENQIEAKSFFKRLKIFCSTGGTLDHNNYQLQGDLVDKVKDVLRKENYQI